MGEISFRQPPPKAKVRPTQRPMSAVHARPAASSHQSAGVGRPASASDLALPAGAIPGTDGRGLPGGGNGPRRKFGSIPPPDRSVHPQKGGFFEKLTAQEAADRFDGLAGTTLPSAAALQEYRERAYVASEIQRAERAATSAEYIAANRAELAHAGRTHVPKSQNKFAWGSDRIANALLSKIEQFSSRHEDHSRKLLWTMGSDPHFKEMGNKNSIRVTPQNFPRLTDKFGIACSENHAAEIFSRHGLDAERGVSLHKMTAAFDTSKEANYSAVREQARRMHGDAVRPAAAMRPRTPIKPAQQYKVAGLCADAWAQHAARDGSVPGGAA